MTVTDIWYGSVSGRVVAAVICLVGCSGSPAPHSDSTREALTTNMQPQEEKLALPPERVRVSVMVGFTNCETTQVLFWRNLSFRKATAPGQIEEWVSWKVVNIHAENYFEIARSLKMASVEVHVLHTGASFERVQELGHPERTITKDRDYAVVTDARIPRKWYLSEPGGNMGSTHLDSKTAQALRAAYPKSFRVDDVGVSKY